ncbi:MAG: outer membrane protein assembly factor BamD [Alphaproteobacteria bacterium]|nr:outer membrane protein assembly factor BamD [Alphaproteobacteria bacterium]
MKKLAVLLFLVCACSSSDKGVEDIADTVVFDRAMRQFERRNYPEATKMFEDMEFSHPYSPLITRAWIMAGYSAYRDKKYSDAADYFDKVLRLRPSYEHIDYAIYMKGLANYDSMRSIPRDQRSAVAAIAEFERLVQRFPDSEYTRDAKAKMQVARNNLAAKEMLIASELFRRRNLLGALDRYQGVVRNFEGTVFVPEALFRQAEIYRMMGEAQPAADIMTILKLNFPDNEWAKK